MFRRMEVGGFGGQEWYPLMLQKASWNRAMSLPAEGLKVCFGVCRGRGWGGQGGGIRGQEGDSLML